jgi:DNA end-binding protein Ku
MATTKKKPPAQRASSGPRSLWNGTIAVGLLTVPVKLHTATESKTVHFHEVHEQDGARIEHRRFCSEEEKEVDYDEVVKGYEISKDTFVVLDDDEVKAAAGDRTHVIDVQETVEADAIDPVFYDHTYHLGAGEDGGPAYRVLHDALAQTGRVALGRFTFHDRERLAAIRAAEKGLLVLHVMRFADTLVPPSQIEVKEPAKPPTKREVEMARKLVDTLHEPFKASRYRDEYREAVLEMIERKAEGEEITPPEPPQREDSDDLMAALEASLKR